LHLLGYTQARIADDNFFYFFIFWLDFIVQSSG